MQNTDKDRQPAVAGTFYPAGRAELTRMVAGFLADAKPASTNGTVRALVVPHAGYVYSGGVAASGFNQLDPDQAYQNVFILASSHRVSLGKASVYTRGDYLTPLGKVEVNREISKKLAANRDFFTDDPVAHIQEHSIEVQLPFLQTILKKPFQIVPIVLASQVPAVCEGVAEALRPFFTPDNLFIVSADFSHYPPYEEAILVDAATAEAFCKNAIPSFLAVLKANERKGIAGLATSMCAWPSALVLLHLTE
ncbi:MAG: AmmeMemoRadiSam system protein B, partial [Bacteroidales bacterium]